MRKKLLSLILLTLVALALLAGYAFADNEENNNSTDVEQGNTDAPVLSGDGNYYVFNRMIDLAETLTQDERKEIGYYIFDFMDDAGCDLQIYIVKSLEDAGVSSADEFADKNFYDEKYVSGYGAERKALFLIYETDKQEAHVVRYGDISGLSDWGIIKAKLYFEYYAVCDDFYDGCYGFIDHIWKDMVKGHSSKNPRTNMMNAVQYVSRNNESTDRVLDLAGILSDSEEEKLRKSIAALREELGVDIVILTAPDNDDYGPDTDDSQRFADDFYDYGGFGYGETREGALLFLNMNPNGRDVIVSIGGDLSYSITDINSSEGRDSDVERLLDAMMNYLQNGQYGAAANTFVSTMGQYIRRDFALGKAGSIEKQYFEGICRDDIVSNPDADRVVDDAGILSKSAKKELEKKIAEIREKYGKDVLILTKSETPGYKPWDYLNLYYNYYGYGEGKERSGAALLLLADGASLKTAYIYSCGDADSLFSTDNVSRILSGIPSDIMNEANAEKAANIFVKKTKTLYKWKHFPMKTSNAVVLLFLIYLLLSIIGKIKKSGNRTVSQRVTASEYIVPGGCNIYHVNEVLLDTKVTRTAKPEPSSYSSSGSRSGGGHSSGGHISSSGSHHSGGGRRF